MDHNIVSSSKKMLVLSLDTVKLSKKLSATHVTAFLSLCKFRKVAQ